MNKYINAFLSLAAVASISLSGGCSKENPFGEEDNAEMGRFLTSSLQVEVNPEEVIVRSTADDVPELSSFTVAFYKEGESAPEVSYRYTELPEIVTLPVGTYSAVAYSGDNAEAAWDVPYYRGESESFAINANEVTEVAEPVVCRLSSVKVSINFSSELTAAMSADSKVTVKVGDSGSLDFTKADEGRHGYFAYVPDSHTLVAHFTGNVEDYPTSVSKARENVEPGNHYIITFSLRSAGDGDPGTLHPSLGVDASVEVEDINGNVIPEDTYLEDDMRPQEGDEEKPDQPNPPVGGSGPNVVAAADSDVKLDGKEYDFGEGVSCKLEITSEAAGGITGLIVDIVSDTLTAAELEGFGLSSHLDLVNPGDMAEMLANLGFPVGNDVKGKSYLEFDISGFGGLLSMLGPGHHEFRLKVTDADGVKECTLKLRTL
ncbi:MAG: DUF4493 domain-containing protein [Muribaculaceae bacterium]|nr:DUF4493 domain-containing protein [Muribaculaceae bacterium]